MRAARWVRSFIVLLFLLIYFASGFSALLYQVIWQRMLAIFSGADVFAATTIVASFMAGLGAGSLYGGSLADRVSLRRQVVFFALAEGLTGILGLLSKWWYYDVLYSRFAYLASSPVLLPVVLFASLLIPTFLMGMTLPLLSKALTPTVNMAGRRIGSLYALNTLGAACGAFVTGWFLMGRYSFPMILQIGASINLGVAVLAVVLGFLWKSLSDISAEPHDVAPPVGSTAEPALSFPSWALVYGLSGFMALSLEIVWFRLLGIILKSNSLTFAHLLGTYLGSLAVGIVAGVQWVGFVRRPARTFLALQSGITAYAGLSVALLIFGLNHWPALGWLRNYLGGYEPFDARAVQMAIENWITGKDSLWAAIRGPHPNFLSLYLLVPVILVAPPTFMMGMSFPFLQRAVQNDPGWIGRRVGWLQATNILGATLGAISVGGMLLQMLGTTGTLRFLIAVSGVFLILWTRFLFQSRSKVRQKAWTAACVVVLLMIWSIPSRGALWAHLHGSASTNVISAEDGSGLSVLKNEHPDFASTTWVYTNGLGQSWIPFTHVNHIHSLLGILPLMLHRDPAEIAVIGLGSGNTLYSLGGRADTKEIVCIEIVGAELRSLRLLQVRSPYAGLDTLFNDVRIHYIFRDGRTYIGANPKKYDIIEADALRPTSAFAGNLYSYEYFLLLKNRLKPGGFAVSWGPTTRVVQTFVKVFPYALNFDSVLIGSAEPIEVDREAIKARMEQPFTREYYAKIDLDVKQLAMPFFERPLKSVLLDRKQLELTDFNSDLFPKDEYAR